MRFSTILAVLSIATVSFAAPTVEKRKGLSKSGGDATFYTPGLGSCGHNNSENDLIVAVDIATITHFPGAGPNPNKNPMCGRKMVVKAPNGKKVTVKVVDTCPGCAPGSVDLSPAAFKKLASLDVGRIHGISWTLQ